VATIAVPSVTVAALHHASSVESTRPSVPRSLSSYPPFRSRAPPGLS
jgi:hypothetical protein